MSASNVIGGIVPSDARTGDGRSAWLFQVAPFQVQVFWAYVLGSDTSITMTLRTASYVIEQAPFGGGDAGESNAHVLPVHFQVCTVAPGVTSGEPLTMMNCCVSASYAAHPPLGGTVAGCCCTQIDPFHAQVSRRVSLATVWQPGS